jgi:NADH-quinone oxidoreductase subunit A
MYAEYLIIIKYFAFTFLLIMILFLLSYLTVLRKPDFEKNAAYECGFNPFGDARIKFEISFYLIGILFIIFDIELLYLFPWILIINQISIFGIYSVLLFIFVLTLGFIYEWIKGALEWI